MMPALPSGTVTFLFTDIEGSSERWERDRVAMEAAIAHHLALLDEAIQTHSGVHFKTVGDAVQAAFPTAPQAVAAAIEAQRALIAEDWGAVGGLPVRMALHAGEATPDDRGDYLAASLNRLSRLLVTGHGGQILLSQTAQQLTRGALPSGAEVRDLGEHRLRDLLEPERIFQLLHPDLPAEFPPLASLDMHPTNLPRQPTPFLGREREVSDVAALLRRADVQLLTLTGPGGTGKTRLALQTAAELVDAFTDGVFFVPLAALTDPGQVPTAIATALGVREEGGQPLPERLAAFLASRQVLLVIDNWEHLLAAAPWLGGLLQAAPRLMVLATSRAPLHLQAEREYPVPSLALPRRQPLPPLDQLTQYEAVRLFIARAQSVKPDFAVDSANAPAVAEICHRLDGLPLALELAAARVRMMQPEALLARLEKRLPLLTGGARDAPARQKTLHQTIAWSHDLLSPEEQRLFRRLAVFAGGFAFEAAEVVANPQGDLDVFTGVTALLEKSLVRSVEGPEHDPRFTMLETIREFGLEQLATSGEEQETRRGHAAYFGALLDRPTVMMLPYLPNTRQVLDRLITEYPNLRAALEWHRTAGDVTGLLQLAGTLANFWILGGQLVDGRMWLEWGLSQDGSTAEAWAVGQLGLASVLHSQSEGERALALCQLCLHQHYQTVGAPLEAAIAFLVAAHIALFLGEPETGIGYIEESARRFAILHESPGQDNIMNHLEMLRGWVAFLRGDAEGAAEIIGAVATRQQTEGQITGSLQPYLSWTLLNLGHVTRAQGDLLTAMTLYQGSLKHGWQFRDVRCCARALSGLAGVLAAVGRWAEAARLYGAVEAFCTQVGLDFQDIWDFERALGLPEPWLQADKPLRREADLLRAVVQAHGVGIPPPLPAPEQAVQAWAVGKELPFEAAMDEALAVDPVRLAAAAVETVDPGMEEWSAAAATSPTG